jgi:hypothetical protein
VFEAVEKVPGVSAKVLQVAIFVVTMDVTQEQLGQTDYKLSPEELEQVKVLLRAASIDPLCKKLFGGKACPPTPTPTATPVPTATSTPSPTPTATPKPIPVTTPTVYRGTNETKDWNFRGALVRNKESDEQWHEIDLTAYPQGGLLSADYSVFPGEWTIYKFVLAGKDRTTIIISEVEVSQGGKNKAPIHIPIDGEKVYVRVSYGLFKGGNPYGVHVGLITHAKNYSAEKAMPIGLPATITSKLVSAKDVNWFKLDLTDYPDGVINAMLAVPATLLPDNKGSFAVTLIESNMVTVKDEKMIKAGGKDTLRTLIRGGQSYYVKVSPRENAYNPTDVYALEITFGR